MTQVPLLAAPAKLLGGIAQERHIPPFAATTFRRWFAQHRPRNPDGPPVILWADTFSNDFEPDIGQAAVEILEDAGFRPEVPGQPLCCGRPLYDYGFLDLARRRIEEVLAALGPSIDAGVPVVTLEPSCGSVFKDELRSLLPDAPEALRLRQQTFLFAEFLNHAGYRPPLLRRRALVHGHCHAKALVGKAEQERLLQAVGLEVDHPESGCCGMAGSFGYEREKYGPSHQIAGQRLLPAAQQAGTDTVLVADGFSCRTQIAQGSTRRALHTAQLLRLAKRTGPVGPQRPYPERGNVQPRPSPVRLALAAAGVVGAAWLLTRAASLRRELRPRHGS